MKKWTWLAALAVCGLLVGCAGPQPAPVPPPTQEPEQIQQAPYRFGIGYSGTGYTESFEQWKELVAQDTQGNVELMLYGENILGEGLEMIKATRQGTLSIVASSTSVCTAVVPQTAILDIPSCFSEYSQPFRVYDGEFFDALNGYYNEQGLELLYLRTGEQWLISSVAPVTALEQLRGLRIRTSGSPYHNKLYDALGIQRIENVGLSGLAYILDENGVDGIETTYTILRSQNLLEVQPYALRGPLFVMSSAVVMNYDAFHQLPEDYQRSLKQRLSEILNQRQTEVISQDESEISICDLSVADQEALRQFAQPLLEEILSTVDPSLAQALLRENAHKSS